MAETSNLENPAPRREITPEMTEAQKAAKETVLAAGETCEQAVERLAREAADGGKARLDEANTTVANSVEMGKKAGLNVA